MLKQEHEYVFISNNLKFFTTKFVTEMWFDKSSADYNLMESIAEYFQIKATYEVVKLTDGITMDEKL